MHACMHACICMHVMYMYACHGLTCVYACVHIHHLRIVLTRRGCFCADTCLLACLCRLDCERSAAGNYSQVLCDTGHVRSVHTSSPARQHSCYSVFDCFSFDLDLPSGHMWAKGLGWPCARIGLVAGVGGLLAFRVSGVL